MEENSGFLKRNVYQHNQSKVKLMRFQHFSPEFCANSVKITSFAFGYYVSKRTGLFMTIPARIESLGLLKPTV